mmetsp:Transcript_10953/g.25944  ORF Transcript_10953/g.25944 Transcript_10953/m.25944 type:complete len:202 (+) Transcript_10953:64-669(+)
MNWVCGRFPSVRNRTTDATFGHVCARRGTGLKLGVAAHENPAKDQQGAHRVQFRKDLGIDQIRQQHRYELPKGGHGHRGHGPRLLDQPGVRKDRSGQGRTDQRQVPKEVRALNGLLDRVPQVAGSGHEDEEPDAADGVCVGHQRRGAQTHSPRVVEQQSTPRPFRSNVSDHHALVVSSGAAVRNDNVRQTRLEGRHRWRRW